MRKKKGVVGWSGVAGDGRWEWWQWGLRCSGCGEGRKKKEKKEKGEEGRKKKGRGKIRVVVREKR